MYEQYMGEVERQVYRDWERRFNKRVARRGTTIDTDRSNPVRNFVEKLKQAF
jgi:hypothetical protein